MAKWPCKAIMLAAAPKTTRWHKERKTCELYAIIERSLTKHHARPASASGKENHRSTRARQRDQATTYLAEPFVDDRVHGAVAGADDVEA